MAVTFRNALNDEHMLHFLISVLKKSPHKVHDSAGKSREWSMSGGPGFVRESCEDLFGIKAPSYGVRRNMPFFKGLKASAQAWNLLKRTLATVQE